MMSAFDIHKSTIIRPMMVKYQDQIEEYLKGERKKFNFDIFQLDIQASYFSKAVWQAILSVPFGKTASYSEIANIIGKPSAIRAVGTACKNNPLPIIIPCHRIVLKSGNYGHYIFGSDVKRSLIEFEISLSNY